MNVSTADIRNIKPGETKAFACEDAKQLYSAASLVARLKRVGMPEGIINYETKKIFAEGRGTSPYILIRAMREGDEPVLNQ